MGRSGAFARIILIAAMLVITGISSSILFGRGAGGAEETNNAAITPEARSQAAEIFDERCSACHGAEGRGDGPGAAALNPKPINFHNLNWQKSVTDQQITKAIVDGGGAVGMSNQMAPNPDLEDEPQVVKALVAHVRELGKQK